MARMRSLTAPATRQVVERKSSEHRENQEREGTNPDNEVDNTQHELDRGANATSRSVISRLHNQFSSSLNPM